MSKVVRMMEHRKGAPFVHFSRRELNQLLGLYSRKVAKGDWRDYAIDHDDTVARFFIFRHANERPLFTIVKRRHGNGLKADHSFSLYSGTRRVRQGASLMELLEDLSDSLRLVQP